MSPIDTTIWSMVHLDDINLDILDLLQYDGRISYKELGERVGLTAPAVTERVRKLEEQGVITGYRATINYEVLGFPLLCVIRLNSSQRRQSNRGAEEISRDLDDVIRSVPEFIEAHRVTGSESHVIRSRARSTAHLEELLHNLWDYGDSITNIVTSSPVPRRPMRLKAAMQ